MKITKFALASLVIASMEATGCSDDTYDIDGSSDTIAYIYHTPNSDSSQPANSFNIEMDKYPTWGIVYNTPTSTEYEVRLTHSSNSDVTVNLGVNDAAVANGYELLPASAYTLSATSLTIPAGERSASFTIEFNDPNAIDADKDYMLPVSITSVDGAVTSENLATALVTVLKTSASVSTSRTGDEITDRTGWSCLYGQRNCPDIINNPSNYTYWFNGTGINPIEISFGKTETGITGVKLQVYSANYAVAKMTVYAAANPGEVYEEVATAEYSVANNTAIISWDKETPVNAYWLRIDATPWSGNGIVPVYATVYKN